MTQRISVPVLGLILLLLMLAAIWDRPEPVLEPAPTVTLKILSTTDVHGWLNSRPDRKQNRYEGGLAEIAALWRAKEGYDPAASPPGAPQQVLVLDSGDMWTGPPESTLAQGAPMVEAYNALGYDAAALGNHEFDFGLDVLRKHAASLRFPILAANVASLPGGPKTDFVRPSTIVDVRGVRVGVIGLATQATPETTFPKYVEGLVFRDYEPVVRAEARRLLDQGATVLVVLAHESVEHMRALAQKTADLPIQVFLGGHLHRRELEVLELNPATEADDIVILAAGRFGTAYGRIELQFQEGRLVAHTEEIVPVEGVLDAPRTVPPDPALAAITERATGAVAERMQERVGHARSNLEVGTIDHSPLGSLILDSWLSRFPQAQVAIGNIGGIRQSMLAGPVTVGDVFAVLPFSNDLVLVRLTPAQLREALSSPHPVVGGLRYRYKLDGERRVVTAVEDAQGRPLDETRQYTVILTDFLYSGGDGFPFKQMDPQPVLLGVNWREPFLELFRSAGEPGVEPPSQPRAFPE